MALTSLLRTISVHNRAFFTTLPPSQLLSVSKLFPEATAGLHSTAVRCKGRKGKKSRKLNQKMKEKLTQTEYRAFWMQERIVPTSPLTKTPHPVDRFAEEEEKLAESIRRTSEKDEPDYDGAEYEDPYSGEPSKCILCPRRYAVPIVPDYKNPKLLAQFVSPHTGLVYMKHITGLCQSMQDLVEREVKRAQAAGYMSTKIKELHYLKDPQLFDPARPSRPNPY